MHNSSQPHHDKVVDGISVTFFAKKLNGCSTFVLYAYLYYYLILQTLQRTLIQFYQHTSYHPMGLLILQIYINS